MQHDNISLTFLSNGTKEEEKKKKKSVAEMPMLMPCANLTAIRVQLYHVYHFNLGDGYDRIILP